MEKTLEITQKPYIIAGKRGNTLFVHGIGKGHPFEKFRVLLKTGSGHPNELRIRPLKTSRRSALAEESKFRWAIAAEVDEITGTVELEVTALGDNGPLGRDIFSGILPRINFYGVAVYLYPLDNPHPLVNDSTRDEYEQFIIGGTTDSPLTDQPKITRDGHPGVEKYADVWDPGQPGSPTTWNAEFDTLGDDFGNTGSWTIVVKNSSGTNANEKIIIGSP